MVLWNRRVLGLRNSRSAHEVVLSLGWLNEQGLDGYPCLNCIAWRCHVRGHCFYKVSRYFSGYLY